MKWHEEALPEDCRRAFTRLSAVRMAGDFYLAGGTALALRLGHRISVDLDFFSQKIRLRETERRNLQDEISATGPIQVDEQKDGTMYIRMSGTRVSFLHYAPPLMARADQWKGRRIAPAMDIGAMKISALIGRGSMKDFLDLYVLTTRLIPLKDILMKAQNKFPHAADFTAQALRALVYFKDAETEDPPRMLEPVSWRDVKKHFEREVRALSRSFMKDRR